ncbi:MAG: hypothetical protein SGJ24_16645 [Chloroflexota bacterium]|nr:hypothetical protein [Chloroflexota bacterium]
MRETVLAAILPRDWMNTPPLAAAALRAALHAHNAAVGLREVEIDFAADGFGDALSAYAFARTRAALQNTAPPPFATIYRVWIDDHVQVSPVEHIYPHGGTAWRVRVVRTIFGRVGLAVARSDGVTLWVSDPASGCPAEHFTYMLLEAAAARME